MYRVYHSFLLVLAGFFPLFGSVPGRALTYDVNVVLGVDSVIGTITTNGHFGALAPTDITGWNLVIKTGPITGLSISTSGLPSFVLPQFVGTPFLASSSVIDFEPADGSASFINGISFWQLLGFDALSPFGGMVFFNDFEHNDIVPFQSAVLGDIPIAVAEPTPLPAALPLFAGGLGALGLLSWRKKKRGSALTPKAKDWQNNRRDDLFPATS